MVECHTGSVEVVSSSLIVSTKTCGIRWVFVGFSITEPSISGGVAQLVRVPASHAGGPGFEPRRVHQKNPRVYVALGFFILPQFRSLFVTCYEQLFYEKARLLVRQADRFDCTIFSPC